MQKKYWGKNFNTVEKINASVIFLLLLPAALKLFHILACVVSQTNKHTVETPITPIEVLIYTHVVWLASEVWNRHKHRHALMCDINYWTIQSMWLQK